MLIPIKTATGSDANQAIDSALITPELNDSFLEVVKWRYRPYGAIHLNILMAAHLQKADGLFQRNKWIFRPRQSIRYISKDYYAPYPKNGLMFADLWFGHDPK